MVTKIDRVYYSIQNIEAWNKAIRIGYLEGDEEYIYPKFLSAYLWMMKQMKLRLPSYQGEYPVWLWTERPDLRRGGYLNRGTRGILLKIVIPKENVLLSDFECWHAVLGGWYVANSDMEFNLIEKRKSQIAKEETWQRIFTLDAAITGNPNPIVQGATGRICTSDIIPIREFSARGIGI